MRDKLLWVAILSFPGVWIGCTIAKGWYGFMCGWMPALVISYILLYVAECIED